MSIRYIVPVNEVTVLDPITDEPLKELDKKTNKEIPLIFTWQKYIRHLFLNPRAVEIANGDIVKLLDLRERMTRIGVAELDDEPWKILCNLARNPVAIAPFVLPVLKDFCNAIFNAPDKNPLGLAAAIVADDKKESGDSLSS